MASNSELDNVSTIPSTDPSWSVVGTPSWGGGFFTSPKIDGHNEGKWKRYTMPRSREVTLFEPMAEIPLGKIRVLPLYLTPYTLIWRLKSLGAFFGCTRKTGYTPVYGAYTGIYWAYMCIHVHIRCVYARVCAYTGIYCENICVYVHMCRVNGPIWGVYGRICAYMGRI